MELNQGIETMDSDTVLRLARGSFRMQRYNEAAVYADIVLEREPNYIDAIIVKRMIDDAFKREGINGVLLVGSWALFLIGGGLAYMKWFQRPRK